MLLKFKGRDGCDASGTKTLHKLNCIRFETSSDGKCRALGEFGLGQATTLLGSGSGLDREKSGLIHNLFTTQHHQNSDTYITTCFDIIKAAHLPCLWATCKDATFMTTLYFNTILLPDFCHVLTCKRLQRCYCNFLLEHAPPNHSDVQLFNIQNKKSHHLMSILWTKCMWPGLSLTLCISMLSVSFKTVNLWIIHIYLGYIPILVRSHMVWTVTLYNNFD